MVPALDRHNALLDAAITQHGGLVFKTVGDAFHASFASAADAVTAAVSAQRLLHAEDWPVFGAEFAPLRVRMGLHTGLVELRDGDYFGPPLNRTARLMAAGYGGQILLSLATQQLVRDDLPPGAALHDLGVHRLKDLRHGEHIFRLTAPDFPDVATPPDTAEELRPAERAHVDEDLLPAECPYRGLFAFREEDAPFFFGRETFTELLSDAIATAPMVGVIGPSGSGKSSVGFAGLVPRLRVAQSHGDWHVLELRPGSRPFHSLSGALLPLYEHRDLTETDRLAEINKLSGYLQDGRISTQDVLARIGDIHLDLGRLLLVTDQFEELYTLCPDDRAQQAFQDVLFSATFERNGGVPLTLALTLRADFMGHALAYRPFADAMQHHNVILGPMTREELSRAVRLPAERQGRAFETGLVERIVDEVGEKAGSLPLLEFALTKLWEQQQAGWLTHDAYEAIGRVEGAVVRHADAVYGHLADGERERARRVFVQLVQPGEGTEDTRRLATREELSEDWPLVRKLADARLITTGRDGAGHETAEVVHEALIRSWGQMREWMNADRTFRTWQERLRFALRQWTASEHGEGTLLRGAPLAEAEGWLSERGAELGTAERDFIEEGVHERDREMRERQAQLEREAASARKLRQRGVWLAGALVAAAALAGHTGAVNSVAWSRDGARVATVSLDRSARLWDASTGTPILNISLPSDVLSVAFSPDGVRLATAGIDFRIWDAATGSLMQVLQGHGDQLAEATFSPDGRMLLTASADKTAGVGRIGARSLHYTIIVPVGGPLRHCR